MVPFCLGRLFVLRPVGGGGEGGPGFGGGAGVGVAVGGFLDVEVVPLGGIHVVGPLVHVGEQVGRGFGLALKDTVDEGHGFGAGDVLVGLEGAVGVAVDPAETCGQGDGVCGPVCIDNAFGHFHQIFEASIPLCCPALLCVSRSKIARIAPMIVVLIVVASMDLEKFSSRSTCRFIIPRERTTVGDQNKILVLLICLCFVVQHLPGHLDTGLDVAALPTQLFLPFRVYNVFFS